MNPESNPDEPMSLKSILGSSGLVLGSFWAHFGPDRAQTDEPRLRDEPRPVWVRHSGFVSGFDRIPVIVFVCSQILVPVVLAPQPSVILSPFASD